jgi:hypothetical protein
MPIEVDATDIEIPAPPTKVKADRLHVDKLTSDSSGEVQSPSNPPWLEVLTRLYAEDANGVRTYSGEQERLFTRNLYVTCAHVPEMAVALGAVFNGVKAWRVYTAARRADEVITRKARDVAQAALDAAQTALATANGVAMTDSSPAAKQAVADAEQAVSEARATVTAASDRWTIAAAAAEDTSNPPLV